MKPMSQNLANAMYWFIILLFLPAILGALQLGGLLDPVQAMVDKILNIIPNIVAAVVIGLVGWFVAKILRDLTTNLLTAAGVDSLGKKAGLRGDVSVSRHFDLYLCLYPGINRSLERPADRGHFQTGNRYAGRDPECDPECVCRHRDHHGYLLCSKARRKPGGESSGGDGLRLPAREDRSG